MKNITTEQIRMMRFRYRHDSDLVSVLNELLEYREAETQSAEEQPLAQKLGLFAVPDPAEQVHLLMTASVERDGMDFYRKEPKQ